MINNKPEKTILIVEDAATYRELYRRFLSQDEADNWQIFMAENGETGLKLYQEVKPDLVLLDYQLPDLDGIKFLERINIGNKIKKLPVLMLTGQGEEALIINAFKQGIQGYLSKDKLSLKTFLWEIHESFENYKIWQENQQNQQKRELFHQIALKIRGSTELQKILETTVREVREILQSDRVLIYQLEADMSGSVTAESVGENWQVAKGTKIKYNCWGKIIRENLFTGKTSAINNINQPKLTDDYLNCLTRWQVKAEIVVPIIINEENNSEGNIWGLLIAHQCSNFREWERTDINLLEDLSIQIAIAIQQAKLYQNLEEKVEERTKELRESERRFRLMADSAPVLIWMSDTEGNCTFFNKTWLNFTGKTLAEEIDNGWVTGVHPEDRESCFQTYLSAFQERKKFKMEYRLKRADGVYRWLLDTGVPRYTEDGNFTGYIGSCIDITERKESEKLLQQINYELENRVAKRTAEIQASEAKFRQFAETIEDVFWMRDLKQNKTEYVSPAYEKVWGRSVEELYANNAAWSEVIHPEDQQRVFIASKRNENLQGDYDVEYRIIRPSGEMRWIRDRAFYIYNQQGEIERIIGVAEDITDKKQAQDELLKVNELQKAILNSTEYSIISTNLEGIIQSFNAGAEKLLGYDAAEVIGKVTPEIIHYFPQVEQQAQILSAELETQIKPGFEVFVAKQKRGITAEKEWTYVRKDGSHIPVRLLVTVMRNTKGEITGFLGIAKDITKEKKIAEERSRLITILELATDVIGIANPQGYKIWTNRQSRKLLQIPDDADLTKIHVSEYHPQWAKELLENEALPTAIKEGIWKGETALLTAKGEEIPVSQLIIAHKSAKGEVEYFSTIIRDIREQKQAQEALSKSETRLKYLLASSPTVIYSAKVSGDFGATFMSENVANHFGYLAEEFTANSEFWFSHIHPEDQGLVLAQLEDLFDKNHKAIEYRFQAQNGEYKWVRDEIKLIRDPQGNPKEIIGCWLDFTQLKQAQQALELSEKRFAITLKSSPISIFNHDFKLRYTWVYSPFEGYDNENMVGKTDLELFSPEEAQKLMTIKQEVIASGISHREVVCLKINGKTRYFDNSIEPLKNELGEIIGLTGVALDVTDRYQQEEVIIELNYNLQQKAAELELAYQKIRDSKQFIDNLVNAVSDPIFVKDRQGRLQLVNDSFCLIFCAQKEEILGKDVYELFPKNEADIFTQKDELVFTTGIVNENEEYFTDAAGITHYISTKKSRFVDSKGDFWLAGVIRDLTERKAIEEALRKSEAKFQRIAANVPGGIYQFVLGKDGDREFPYISDRFQEIFELDSTENLTENVFNKIYPEDNESLEEAITASADNLTQFAWEGRLLLPSGKIKWIEVLSQPEQQENGDILWDGLIVEITERKETERQLIEQLSLSKLRLEVTNALTQGDNLPTSLQKCTEVFVNNLNLALARIWLLNKEENILELQASAGLYTHLNGDHARIRVGEYKVGKIAELRRCFASNSVIEGESIHNQEWAKKEGITAFVGYPLLLENELMGVIAMFARHPFTETVVKELKAIANFIALGVEQQRQEEALLISEKRYRQIVETAQEGIWLIDRQAKTTYVNPQMANMLGYSVEEMLGSYLYDFMDQVACIEWERNFSKRQHGIEETHDFRFKRKDGSDLWTMVSTTVIRNELGEFDGVLGMIADISERVKIEETLREANNKLVKLNAELERATRLKDDFLANMSHELRTPLNSILGLSEALQTDLYGELTERQKRPLITIENSGKHLLDLINDILDLAKIEAGKMELHIAPVRVRQLCQQSLTFIQQQAYQKNINLSTNIPEVEIAADERRMRQALINLLSNAVKFTPEGGSISLEVEVNVKEKKVSFNVIDTGIGIAAENLSQLFQPFSQVDSSLSRHYDGTGLGLALVHTITELHQGKVSVVSQLGVGSKFTITLPWQFLATNDNLPEQSGEKGNDSPTNSLPQVKSKYGKILIADDNDDNIEVFLDYLTIKGYDLRQAKNGLDAINMALKERPNLIIMDIQMPEMDGLTAIKRIRTLEEIKDIPIIALTALAMSGDREKCLEAGANEYLTKPVRLSQLAGLISSLI